jgi:RNA-directed DNA polymerase
MCWSLRCRGSHRRLGDRDWVEKKIRRHMGRSRNRRGFGWKRWSRRWLCDELKLFNGYRVRRQSVPKALPA